MLIILRGSQGKNLPLLSTGGREKRAGIRWENRSGSLELPEIPLE